MLYSGSYTYGNDVWIYIESVSDRLLQNDKGGTIKTAVLCDEAKRCYCINNKSRNDFFSTGLIVQFTNEAQLAYVLAHEIIHFKHNHVIESFKFESNNKRSLQQLSQYPKEHEFETDREAGKMCHDAGYSKDEV